LVRIKKIRPMLKMMGLKREAKKMSNAQSEIRKEQIASKIRELDNMIKNNHFYGTDHPIHTDAFIRVAKDERTVLCIKLSRLTGKITMGCY